MAVLPHRLREEESAWPLFWISMRA